MKFTQKYFPTYFSLDFSISNSFWIKKRSKIFFPRTYVSVITITQTESQFPTISP